MTVPMRTCVGCRRLAPASDLLRVVVRDGDLTLAAHGGRGAWLCQQVECFDRAAASGRFSRALRVSPTALSVAALRTALVSTDANVGG